MRVLISVLLIAVLAGCTHVRSSQDVSVSGQGTWLVLPLVNRTATPQAGLRAAAIVESVLYRHGVQRVEAYPETDNDGVLFEASSPAIRKKWHSGSPPRMRLTLSVVWCMNGATKRESMVNRLWG